MAVVARTKLATPGHGTMLAFVAYIRDTEVLVALAVCLRAALPGKA